MGYIAWWMWDVYYVQVQRRGGRRSKWLRNSGMVRHLQKYFPVELVKTSDFDPNKNYLMGIHPHGIMGAGALICFATDTCGFPKKFPGITPHLLTLTLNFYWPIARAYFLYLGKLNNVSEERALPAAVHTSITN